jgi:signal transduction histidine kinase
VGGIERLMGRRANPATVEAEAKRSLIRKASKKGVPRSHKLEKRLTQAHAQVTEALAQQSATSTILRIISASPNGVQPVFDTIAESAVRLCGGLFGGVYRFDGDLIHLVARKGWSGEELEGIGPLYPRAPSRETPVAAAIADSAVVIVRDIERQIGISPQSLLVARTLGYRSMLVVPMLRDGKPIGAIAVARAKIGPFSVKQIELLKTFADQAVIAIENVRLFTELRARTADLTRSVDQLIALGEVGRTINSTLDLETVLQTIVARANQLAGTDGCTLWEYDATAEEFRRRARSFADEREAAVLDSLGRDRAIPKAQGLGSRAVLLREPVQIPDIMIEGVYESPARTPLLQAGHRALLAVPLLRQEQIIGVLGVSRKTPGAFDPETVRLLQAFAAHSALAIENARLFREIADKSAQLEERVRVRTADLRQSQQELRALSGRLLLAQETESRRIARELHDDLNQGLALLSVEMELLGQNPPESAGQLGGRMLELTARVRQLSSSVHALSHGLHPAKLEQLGVVSTVRGLCRELAQAHGLEIEFMDHQIPEVIAPDTALCLYRLAQEGLRNAIKHSGAQHVSVDLTGSADAISLRIVDDGVGFDPRLIQGKEGLGLVSMRERVIHLDGEITINSRPSTGTRIDVWLPLVAQDQAGLT